MKKTQIGWMIIAVLLAINIFIIYQHPKLIAIVLITAISFIILLLFFNLTIIVNNTEVKYSFGVGLIRGSFRIKDIESCKQVSYFPLGWGIRYRPGVVLYNVSGNKAIELSVKGKKRKVWIGTDQPALISEYINKILLSSSKNRD